MSLYQKDYYASERDVPGYWDGCEDDEDPANVAPVDRSNIGDTSGEPATDEAVPF